MNRAKRTDLITIIVLCAIGLAIALSALLGGGAPSSDEDSNKVPARTITYEDYNGEKIGIATGTNLEAESFKYFPDSEYLYFDGYPGLIAALENGTIDAFLLDEPAARSMHAEQPQIDYIKERLTNNYYSFAFRKNDQHEKELCEEFNAFLRKIKQDGTYDKIDATWFGTDESKKVVDMSGLTGENGTIRVVTTSTDEPFSYIKDGKHVGYDIDVAVRFCRECGYSIEIGDVDFQARIPALQAGQYDFTTTMNVTPEREEAVLFSDPVSEGGIVVAVRAEDLAETSDASAASVSSFDGKRAGVITGSFHDSVVEEYLPTSTISNYDSYTDLTEALRTGKIDYFLASTEVAASLMEASDDLVALSEPVKALDIGAMFAKTPEGERLKAQMDEFLTKAQADGTLDEIYAFWSNPDNVSTPVDMSGLTGENGTLRFATSGTKTPVSFQVGDQIAGSDPDIAVRFCRAYGYDIDVSTVNTAGIIPGITTGVYDFSLSDMVITAERQESVNFSIPYHQTDMLLVTRKSTVQTEPDEGLGFLERVALSFEKNFIREDRWKLIMQGIATTCLITALSVLLGSVFAFGICIYRRTGSSLANLIADIFVRVLQGTPTVVPYYS